MHVFLTGEKQIGKSTALRSAAALLGRPVYGFRTFFVDRMDDQKKLYMLPAASQEAPQDAQVVTRFVDRHPCPLPERFDAIGGALLQQARAHPEGLIIMDECSRFERDALRFQHEILQCLAEDTPVLGVVRLNAAGWVESIRKHPNVKVLTVTADNRDELPQLIVSLLSKGENHG